MRKGIAVSPGVAIGTAYCLDQIFVDPHSKRLEDGEVTAELARYEKARDKAATDLVALQKKVAAQVGRNEAAIFTVHESILRDSAFTKKVRRWIVDDRIPAQAALHRFLEEYSSLFTQTKDEYLRERLNDVRDVIVRISQHLTEVLHPEQTSLAGPLIVVADELLPSQAVALGKVDVHGIVTQAGSQTSHAAIIARSRGIPAISGVHGILNQVKTGDTIVVDGRSGHVIVNPEPESLSAFRKLEREFFLLQDKLAENRDQPAVTSDAIRLELNANINNLADAESAVAMGADGVGLYRTEYLYLTHPDVPDEEEQLKVYEQIVLASPGHSVTIRTLDIGGDKTVAYLGRDQREANPFMGWRSVRLSFEHPHLFMTQIRAIMRAAALAEELGGEVRILFPMITTLEEMRRVRGIVRRAEKRLVEEGKPYGKTPVGLMLEVPAAAVSIDTLLEVVDFVSIGSNDLVQYLMAADRDNPRVSHLCQPLAPPVLTVLSQVVRACRREKIPVTICGEMAGQPRAFVLLLGMGLTRFSMSPAFIPSIKDLAAHLTQRQAAAILREAMEFKTTVRVQRFMAEQLLEIAPNLSLLDSD